FKKEGFAWRDLEKEKLKVLLEWHFSVITAGIDSPHFPQDPEQISALLGHRVSPITVRDALSTLAELNLISRNPKTQRWQTTKEGFVTPYDVPSVRVRASHQKVLREAQKAIEKYPVDEREYIHVAFPAPLDKLPEIKKKIREFVVKTTHAFWDSETPLVHRLGVYLYPETNPALTKSIAAKKKGR
ncbi:MAG: TIGR02147 family protein, partial [Proteobacteria bacterium]